MEKQEIIGRLVKMYLLLERDELAFKGSFDGICAANQKFGVRMAASALSLWDEVCEKIEQKRLTENKS